MKIHGERLIVHNSFPHRLSLMHCIYAHPIESLEGRTKLFLVSGSTLSLTHPPFSPKKDMTAKLVETSPPNIAFKRDFVSPRLTS
jgi:hypothetical protein